MWRGGGGEEEAGAPCARCTKNTKVDAVAGNLGAHFTSFGAKVNVARFSRKHSTLNVGGIRPA